MRTGVHYLPVMQQKQKQKINNTPNIIIDKIHTHSLCNFLNYIKVFILVITKITIMFRIVIYANLDIYVKINIITLLIIYWCYVTI